MNDQEITLTRDLQAAFEKRLLALGHAGFSRRLAERDTSLWGDGEAVVSNVSRSLGWLSSIPRMQELLGEYSGFKAEALASGFTHAVCLGMGGSSMAPLVFERSFEPTPDGLKLKVLDTTDPGSVLRIADSIPLTTSLFMVASKSGTTAEPLALMEYFLGRLDELLPGGAGGNFIAITDPGSWLEEEADRRGFRRVFHGIPDIGGRFSALSPFGILPAVLAGLDVESFLSRARDMMGACSLPEEENPGVILGAAIGELALRGRDKLTLFMPELMETFGLWLEQLLAESTGKEGKGILPVAAEPAAAPHAYGDDRVFVVVETGGEDAATSGTQIAALSEAGHPVIRVRIGDLLDLGAEFLRWEVATATAGYVLGINPFDQPNVQESKDLTNAFLEKVKQEGGLPPDEPDLTWGPLGIYGGDSGSDVVDAIAAFLKAASPGDYFSLMAYITETPAADAAVKSIRLMLREALGVATTSGYGPRFLHSTGQLHKGGPNTGIFLQLTAGDEKDAPVPGSPFSFGTVKRAQAMGDLEALKAHGRRALRIDLGGDVPSGMNSLKDLLAKALA